MEPRHWSIKDELEDLTRQKYGIIEDNTFIVDAWKANCGRDGRRVFQGTSKDMETSWNG